MKGEIFNLLEEFITTNWGEETYEEIFQAVHEKLATKEPFVGPGTYPDTDFLAIVGQTVERLGVSLDTAVHGFGKFCFPKLAAKMPQYVENHAHPKTFLQSLHEVIHVEVKKVYKDATPPDFEYRDPAPNQLIMIYKSKRKLYSFVEGLLDGVSEFYSVPIEYTRNEVQSLDSSTCEFTLTFA